MKALNKIIGGSIGVAAALAFGASTTQAQNLLVNGDFESASGFTANPIPPSGANQGWALFGQVSRTNMFGSPIDAPESGSYALLEQNAAGNNWNPAGAYQIVGRIIPGDTYTLTVWSITDTGTTWGPTPLDVELGWNDSTVTNNISSGPAPSGSFSYGTSVANNANGWTESTITGVAPVGAQYAIVYLMFMDDNQTTTENEYYDNAYLSGPPLEPIPEPSAMALVGMGLAIVPFFFRRMKKN